MSVVVTVPPFVRWAPAAECETGAEIVRLSLADGVHWFSGAAISFARGLNDTPKIVGVLLVAAATSIGLDYFFVALVIAIGGVLGAVRVAHTLGKKITPMAAPEAVTANLVAAALVTLASPFALPVSTTHVTSGGIFGIGLLRKHEADWSKVRDILLSWIVTLPLGAVLAPLIYRFLLMCWS
jgi:PiT family inorganic phosphate transporter